MKIKVNNQSIDLAPSHIVGSGGEGDVYVKDGDAYKIYHPTKTPISLSKIKELAVLTDGRVLGPRHPIFDTKGKHIGFQMPVILNPEHFCQVMNFGFCRDHSFGDSAAIELNAKLSDLIRYIHSHGILIVDANEFNFLLSRNLKDIFAIDVDSYQTPTFHATAIMDSIRDRTVKNHQYSEGSDWFSVAILMFQVYTKFHPYKAVNPDYNRKDWLKMMDENISIFSNKSKAPPASKDLNVIPPGHLSWFKKVFLGNERCSPPDPNKQYVAPVGVVAKARVILSTSTFQITHVADFPENIVSVGSVGFSRYTLTEKALYANGKKLADYHDTSARRFLVNGALDLVVGEWNGAANVAKFFYGEGEEKVINSDGGIFSLNGRFYSVNGNDFSEWRFNKMGQKYVPLSSVLVKLFNKSQVFDGGVFSYFGTNTYAILPYTSGKATKLHLTELDQHRITSAKYRKGFLITMSEFGGKYFRNVFKFNENHTEYNVRQIAARNLEQVNFIVLDNGVCVSIVEDEYVEGFKDNACIKRIDNPPFDSSMKMFSDGNEWFFVDGKSIFKGKTN